MGVSVNGVHHTHYYDHMEVSYNGAIPKSSILIGCSLINHPFGGTPIYGNPHILEQAVSLSAHDSSSSAAEALVQALGSIGCPAQCRDL